MGKKRWVQEQQQQRSLEKAQFMFNPGEEAQSDTYYVSKDTGVTFLDNNANEFESESDDNTTISTHSLVCHYRNLRDARLANDGLDTQSDYSDCMQSLVVSKLSPL